MTVAVALPAAALAEPAPDGDTAEVGATAQPQASETQASETQASPTTTNANALEEQAGGRSNCKNDYTQNCFQAGSSRERSDQLQSYAQPYFQPGAQPEQ